MVQNNDDNRRARILVEVHEQRRRLERTPSVDAMAEASRTAETLEQDQDPEVRALALDLKLAKANVAMSLSRYDVAESIYREVIAQIKPGDRKNDRDIDLAMARGQLALLCSTTGREVECAQLCRDSIKDYGDHAESALQWFGASAYGELGLILRAQGDFEEAYAKLGEAARRLEHQNRVSVLRRYALYQLARGSVAERLQRDDEALKIYRTLSSIKTEHQADREIRNFLLLGVLGAGIVLERLERLENAGKEYMDMLERAANWKDMSPNLALIHNRRASVLFRLGRLDEGLAALETVVALGQDSKDPAIREQVRQAETAIESLGQREKKH